ncbi:hypothetical protein V1511DRAFT_494307 [Dipodascopsis uninucleata]
MYARFHRCRNSNFQLRRSNRLVKLNCAYELQQRKFSDQEDSLAKELLNLMNKDRNARKHSSEDYDVSGDNNKDADIQTEESNMNKTIPKIHSWNYLLQETPMQGTLDNDTSDDVVNNPPYGPGLRHKRPLENERSGHVTPKEKSIFDSLFAQVLSGKTKTAEIIGRKGRPRPVHRHGGALLNISSLRDSKLFDSVQSSNSNDSNITRNSGRQLKNPSSWLQVQMAQEGVFQYAASMRSLLRNATATRRGLYGELANSQLDHQTRMAENDRISTLKYIMGMMEECQTDRSLEDILEERVYRPFKNASELFQTANKELQISSKISTNYPYLLRHAIRIYIQEFNSPEGAISVFERAKRYGAESYILGCTADTYNDILEIRWDYMMDLYGCKTLLDEMIMNGVEFNVRTTNILNRIKREISDIKNKPSQWLVGALASESRLEESGRKMKI